MKRKILSVLCVAFIVLCFVSCKPDTTAIDFANNTANLQLFAKDFNVKLQYILEDASKDRFGIKDFKCIDTDYEVTFDFDGTYRIDNETLIKDGEMYLSVLTDAAGYVRSFHVTGNLDVVVTDSNDNDHSIKGVSIRTSSDEDVTKDSPINITSEDGTRGLRIQRGVDGNLEFVVDGEFSVTIPANMHFGTPGYAGTTYGKANGLS